IVDHFRPDDSPHGGMRYSTKELPTGPATHDRSDHRSHSTHWSSKSPDRVADTDEVDRRPQRDGLLSFLPQTASSTAIVSRVSATSCTLMTSTPADHAGATTANDPARRSATALPVNSPRNDFRLTPSSTGKPSEHNAGNCRNSSRLSCKDLPKPMP